ncbi:MAG TPA: hemerythrin domain-containing protein [Polyangiaceae bacterium]|nr:hemerythrin domain-containing protein [Polyangiaceae bacterium]
MNPIQQRLDQDHRELNSLLWRLSDDACAPSRDALQATWAEVERRLLAHLEAEEQYLLPLVAASHPAQVNCTRSEHEQIRRLVSELGVAIDLHAARQPAISELIRVLHEHAEREDRTLYRFAGEKASVAVQHRIVTMLKETVRFTIAAANKAVARATRHDSTRANP